MACDRCRHFVPGANGVGWCNLHDEVISYPDITGCLYQEPIKRKRHILVWLFLLLLFVFDIVSALFIWFYK